MPSDTIIVEGLKLGIGFVFGIIVLYLAHLRDKEHKEEYKKIIIDQAARNEKLTSVLEGLMATVRDGQEITRDLIQYNDLKDTLRGNSSRGSKRT